MSIIKLVKSVPLVGDARQLAEAAPGDQITTAEVFGLMGRNMLINCGIPINQRGFAGGLLTAATYGYDMWKAGAGGCTLTINATTGVWTHTSGPVVQVVESPQGAWGVPLTISVEDPSADVSVSVGGSTGTILAGSGRKSVTLTPAGSGNMIVQLTATAATYSHLQLERGQYATGFDYRAQAIELVLCQRYCRVFNFDSGSAFTMATALSATSSIAWLTFGDMRQIPAAAIQGTLVMTGAGPVSSPATPTLLPSSNNNMAMLLAVVGKTTGQSGYYNPSPSAAKITLDAGL